MLYKSEERFELHFLIKLITHNFSPANVEQLLPSLAMD